MALQLSDVPHKVPIRLCKKGKWTRKQAFTEPLETAVDSTGERDPIPRNDWNALWMGSWLLCT